jgi:8-hydroxy-5-deazaflavin:NADPH oxidoreductase
MKIGIIGTGKMASGLGKHWISKGHEIKFGSRDPEKQSKVKETLSTSADVGTISEAANFSDVILFAVPGRNSVEAIGAAGSLAGKTLIDCSNPIGWGPEGMYLLAHGTTSGAEELAKLAAGAKVVKAFNSNFSQLIHAGGQTAQQQADSFYCGDDEHAKAAVATLVRDAGFNGIDIGPLKMARYLEPFAALLISLARKPGGRADLGYKLLFSE